MDVFLIADIARLCKAEVTAASVSNDSVSMNAEGWPDMIIICANDKTLMYPASLPRDQYLMIQGAACCACYRMLEYWDDEDQADA